MNLHNIVQSENYMPPEFLCREYFPERYDIMISDKKRLYYLIGGCIAAVLVLVILAILLFGGKGRQYNKFYNSAEEAFLQSDYPTALEQVNKALNVKSTSDAYLLLADIYYAQGNIDKAIQVLYLGYSHTGSEEINTMLSELKSQTSKKDGKSRSGETVTIAGQEVETDASSLVLVNTSLSMNDLAQLSTLTDLESLSVSADGIVSISLLSSLKSLTFLQISDNSISDLSALNSLSSLKTLYIDNNPIDDFSPLCSLSNLRTLSMKGIPITSTQLNALRKALPNCNIYADEPDEVAQEVKIGGKIFRSDVTELNLAGLDIDDISVLSTCTNLKKLDLRDNQISDISPLIDLQKLEWLCLWNNEVADIYPLMSLTSIQYLDFDGNNVSDISVLEYLQNLEELWISNNPLRSIEPLRKLGKLTRLGLENTDLEDDDLDALMRLDGLKELNIKANDSLTAGKYDELVENLPHCTIAHDDLRYLIRLGEREYYSDETEISAASAGITTLEGLDKFTELKTLNLPDNQLTDLSPLKEVRKLEILRLGGNGILDLSPLSAHSALRTLDLKNNKITGIAPLADCIHLKTLDLSGNSISVITPLAACSELTELDLDNNAVTDLSPLASLTSLKTLRLENNRISDLSALYSLSSLETVYLRGNSLKEDNISALQTMLPNCIIVHDAEPEPTLLDTIVGIFSGGSRP